MSSASRRDAGFSALPAASLDQLLLQVEKPSRYIGGEVGAVVKDPAKVDVRWALAFPDLYEVGMSHFGYQILYGILNEPPWCSAERVYSPAPDFERELRAAKFPLFTLETRMPLAAMDVVGFTLQYELCAGGVLQILDLAGVPLRAAERGEDDPLIIAGGPCALNPEPWAPFFDALYLGEGEEGVVEAAAMIRQANAEQWPRPQRVEALGAIGGFYLPSRRQPRFEHGRLIGFSLAPGEPARIKRRIVRDLETAAAPRTALLPNALAVHNRLAVEVQRGCTRGCRFCQAGYSYRPVRERSADRVMQLIEEGLAASGHSEVSLLSLSSGDWTPLTRFLPRLMRSLAPRHVALSVPSLRAESLTGELADAIRQVRRTGFTIAPEAATERMRRVINKPIDDETVLQTARMVYAAGWNLLKLYFMIGLPTETDGDVDAVLTLIRRVFTAGRDVNRRAALNATISVFIPKPHTPFERFGMAALPRAQQRLATLGRSLFRGQVSIKAHDPRMSQLEGAIARGDRRMGEVIEQAYRRGARLDAWSEHFDYARWQQAFSAAGLNLAEIAEREFADDEPLPWDGVDTGVSPAFLLAERNRALAGETTHDCRDGKCADCGLCDDAIMVRLASEPVIESVDLPESARATGRFRYRLRYRKQDRAKWFGHLELAAVFARAVNRAKLRVLYSEGFHPQPRIVYGPPPPAGVASEDEWVEVTLAFAISPPEIIARLADVLPDGLIIEDVNEIAASMRGLADAIEGFTYEIDLRRVQAPVDVAARIKEFLARANYPVEVVKKSGLRTIDARALVLGAELIDDRVRLSVRHDPTGGLRPMALAAYLLGIEAADVPPTALVKRATRWKSGDLAGKG